MTATPRAAACGSWRSPISAARVAAASVRRMQPTAAGGYVYWVESRPEENGRCVLVRGRPGERNLDLTPAPYSVRSRVHEYGGGAYAVTDSSVYFVNDMDQQLHMQGAGGGPVRKLTGAVACRFADLVPDGQRRRLVCVREDHGSAGAPVNTLAAVDTDSGSVTGLACGRAFYSSPALSPDGTRLAWLSWDPPQMPWDGCELWLAELDAAGIPTNMQRIAGGAEESLFQPRFSPAGILHFVSDRSGYWNLYKYARGGITAVTRDPADYGFAQWNLGMSSYGFDAAGGILAARTQAGRSVLVRITAAGTVTPLTTPYTQIEHLSMQDEHYALLAGAPATPPAIIAGRGGRLQVLAGDDAGDIPATFMHAPEAMRFPGGDGEYAYAWYYPPQHPHCTPLAGEKPPLMVKCHGGPTAMSGDALDLRIRFWTSRGFAVMDVNYRGSSAFGRAYRQSLRGQWGVKDAEDCIRAARWLVAQGLADENRLIISGSSAGGFTALCALAFHDCFRAGAVYYGISELATAMTDTHKFEAHYGTSLLGPWPAARALYRARSPLYAADRIRSPVIFFQGLKDRVVPPDQTVRMVEALRRNRVPVAYLGFPDEGHGFRRGDTLRHTLEAELAFYARLFGFTPAETLPALAVHNLAGSE